MVFYLLWGILALISANADAAQVCYGKYGCFNDNAPFNRVGIPFPQPPSEVGTEYHVFRKGQSEAIIDDSDVTKLQASGYDGSKKTVVIIHGWTGSIEESQWMTDLKPLLANKEDVNIITVEWKEGAAEFYTISVANTRLVGAQIEVLIKFINDQTGNNPSSFHVIGFSLGAQIAGYTGRRLQAVKIGRITGLDPAGPYYSGMHTDVRLDSSDAAFVDVIHTDSGVAGVTTRSGHIDFYPNSGKNQRGCKLDLSDLKSVACSHLLAPEYYIDSLNCKPKAYPCSNWDQFTHGNCMSCPSSGCPEMGHNADKLKGLVSGQFYLYTNQQSPFCVFQYVYVTFITSGGWFAGGRNPKIRILGSKGNSEKIELEKRDLAAGSTERFIAPLNQDLGTLQSIEVWNDLGLALDGWKLKQVNVQFVDGGQSYHACYYGTWIYTTSVKRGLYLGSGNC